MSRQPGIEANALRPKTWLYRNLSYAFRDRGWVLIAAAVGAALVGTAATVLAPLIARQVIDSLAAGAPRLAGPVALLLGAAAARLFAGYVRRRFAARLALRVEYDMRREMFAAAQRGGRLDTGQLVARSTSDLALVHELFGLLPMLAMNGALLLLAVGVMVALSPVLTAVALLIVPAVVSISRRSQRVVFPAMWDAQHHVGKLAGIAQESIGGIGVVLGFGQEERAASTFDGEARGLFAARMRLARLASRYLAALQSVPPLGQIAILALGGWLALRGQISVGTFVAFSAYLVHIVAAARGYAAAVVALQQGKASVLRILEVIDAEPDVAERPDAPTPGRVHGSVTLDGVTFGYDPARPVLDGLDLRVEPGETVALVGASGSGKSTVATLLGRYHDVQRGTITIGGYDVRDLGLAALRRQVGIAFEDPFLFAATIRENIAYGRPDATLAQVRDAAVTAAADGFIRALPDGYDTVVGERGATLSGGQRQRIALARTLLLDPPILVLDEATSAVDPAVEAEILGALARPASPRTTLLISHRPAVLRLADRIAVLDGGRVVDVGTDEELLARCPVFAQLRHGSGLDVVVDPARRVVGMLTRTPDEGGPADPMPRSAIQDALSSPPSTAAVLRGVAALPEARDAPAEGRKDGGFSLRGLLSAHRWLLLAAVGLVALDSVTGLAQPVLIRHALDAGIVRGAPGALFGTVLAALVLAAVAWSGTMAQTRVTWRAAEEVLYALRTRTFQRLLRLGMAFYEREPAGRILSRLTVDVAAVSTLVQTGLPTIAVSVLSMTGVLVVMATLDGGLTLALVPLLAVVVLVTLYFRARSHRQYGLAREQASQLAAYLQESLAGRRVVHAMDRTGRDADRYAELADGYRGSRYSALMQGAACFAITECLSTVATAVIVGLGAGQVAAGAMSLGTLVAFLLYVDLLFGPIQQVSQSVDSYQQAAIGLLRLRELDAVPVTTPEPADPVPVNVLSGRIGCADVRFRYPGAAVDAVHGISLDLRAGETVALVGETGSGKSTLLKLIARFYDVSGGSVTVDGVDVRRFATTGYRGRLGIVAQEPFLFAGTVRDNIAYGRPGATDREIEEVAEAIGAHGVLSGLPDGYLTQVGPVGQALSAGQRQLVALARAYTVDPEILLLDEATAALDLNAEAAYQRAVSVLRRRRTTVMIAHRLTTAQCADRIVVLRRGRVVESGPHEELLGAGREYARLWAAYRPRSEVAA